MCLFHPLCDLSEPLFAMTSAGGASLFGRSFSGRAAFAKRSGLRPGANRRRREEAQIEIPETQKPQEREHENAVPREGFLFSSLRSRA